MRPTAYNRAYPASCLRHFAQIQPACGWISVTLGTLSAIAEKESGTMKMGKRIRVLSILFSFLNFAIIYSLPLANASVAKEFAVHKEFDALNTNYISHEHYFTVKNVSFLFERLPETIRTKYGPGTRRALISDIKTEEMNKPLRTIGYAIKVGIAVLLAILCLVSGVWLLFNIPEIISNLRHKLSIDRGNLFLAIIAIICMSMYVVIGQLASRRPPESL